MQLPRPTSNENLLDGVSRMADALERLLNGNLTGANILDGTIFDADIAAAAAIARSKLNFGSGLVDADIAAAAAIARSKLNFGAGLVDADIAAGAGIALSKLAAPAYSTYTPAWTSTGTAPALGNGTISGRYNQIGKQVHCAIALTAGSTTTYGTGSWAFSLPVTANTSLQHNGQAMCFDNSAGAFYSCFAHSVFGSGTTVNVYTGAQPAVVVGLGVPFAWATSDILQIDFLYEAA